tara:strand:+ start:49595 stop:51424 length:1830 start_codon:yes stop_codon:yes gene_type:complete
MADFSLSQISGPSGGGSAPIQGVQQPSTGAAVASTLSNIFRAGFANAGQQAAQANAEREAELKAQGHKVVSRFATQQMEIADAVDRGEMSSQQARRQMRINLARNLADNPGFEEDIRKAHGDVIGTAGMGKVAAEGTRQEQEFFSVMGDAMAAGWVSADDSEEEQRKGTLDFIAFNRSQQMIDAQQNEIALRRAQLGEQSDRISLETSKITQGTARINQRSALMSLQQQEAEVTGRANLAALNRSYLPKFQKDTEQVLRQFQQGTLSPEEANRQLDGLEQQYTETATSIGMDADPSFRDGLAAPYKTTISNARSVVSGERDLTSYQNANKIAVAKAVRTMSGDPEVVTALAFAEAFPQSPEVQQIGSNLVTRKLGELAKPTGNKPFDTTDPDEVEATKTSLEFLKGNLDRVSSDSGSITSDQKQTVDRSLNRVLSGVNAYGMAVDDPAQFNQVVDFLASDQYGNYVSAGGTGIDSGNVQRAKDVLQAEYSDVVLPLVQEEYNKATIHLGIGRPGDPYNSSQSIGMGMPEETPVAKDIEPIWTGSGLTFRTSSNDASAKAKVRDLNKRVAPVVTKLVKMGAHLGGNRNYESVYNDQFSTIFTGDTSSESN